MKRNSLNAAVLSKPNSVFYLRTSKQDIIKEEGTGLYKSLWKVISLS